MTKGAVGTTGIWRLRDKVDVIVAVSALRRIVTWTLPALSFRPQGGICFSRGDALAPIRRQVLPCTIRRYNQRDFLLSTPLLDFRFADDCIVHILKRLVVDKSGNVVTLGKAVGIASFVLQDPGHEKAGDADVENTALAGHDVDVVFLLARQKADSSLRFGMTRWKWSE